jgi:hypothetical protein
MESGDDVTLEARVTKLEGNLAEIARKLDAMSGGSAAPRPGGSAQRVYPAQRAARPNPFASRSVEWWLARGGALLTSVALILLYQYAVERNWITPVVRVLMGSAVGVALIVSGFRIPRPDTQSSGDRIGLREVLLGAGLAAWYITAYAAAVFYQLIPMSAARLVFLVLSIAGVWLALREKRVILALLALAVGFSTPALLPSINPSVPAFAVYLGALAALGSIVYLMRGWQSILWLTFGAVWYLAGEATGLACCTGTNTLFRITGSPEMARLAIALLIVFAGLTLTRVPSLRRRLLATGSDLYTSQSGSEGTRLIQDRMAKITGRMTGYAGAFDSLALWVITLFSPLIAILELSWVWPSASGFIWGAIALFSAALAYRLTTSARDANEELTQVKAAAAAMLSLAGLVWIASASGSSAFPSSAVTLIALALHAFLVVRYLGRSRFTFVLRIGLSTAALCLFVVTFWELGSPGGGRLASVEPAWTFAELCVAALGGWTWWTFRDDPARLPFARLMGVTTYLALMLIDARVLGFVWPPLVTTSFALAGTVLLLLSRSKAGSRLLRRLGAFTLVIVVARLLFIDLAGVETIWRVLLFLGCGALFLFTSHRLQATAAETTTPETVR